MSRRLIVIVGFPGVQGLDLTGPLEVFAGARSLVERTGAADPGYDIVVAGHDGAGFRTDAGLRITPDLALADVPGEIDTLLVPGGDVALTMDASDDVVRWLRDRAGSARRVASVCSGAFLLAEAGLLAGKRAATHWSACEELRRRHPDVQVESDPIYVRDGAISTSAGVTAGMDLALALVEEDLGRRAALTIARWLVMFLRRPGNQTQFSVQLREQTADREPVRDLQHWLRDHLALELTITTMAARACMSPRHFARVFTAQVGVTPGRYVQQLRLEAVRRRLEESDAPAESIATACGFGSPETMRRVFTHALGIAPAEYRRRFRAPATETWSARTRAAEIAT